MTAPLHSTGAPRRARDALSLPKGAAFRPTAVLLGLLLPVFSVVAGQWPTAASLTTGLGATQGFRHRRLGVSAHVGERGASVTLNVHVSGFENADGAAGIAVWNGARGFPEQIEHAVATTYAPIQDGVAVAGFDELEPGRYAITVYHDTNDNRRFDKNWLGLPKEAWGVSNNVRPRLRAPRFAEATFDLEVGDHLVEIRVH